MRLSELPHRAPAIELACTATSGTAIGVLRVRTVDSTGHTGVQGRLDRSRLGTSATSAVKSSPIRKYSALNCTNCAVMISIVLSIPHMASTEPTGSDLPWWALNILRTICCRVRYVELQGR